MTKLPISLTTPHGHRVEAQVDVSHESLRVLQAHVVAAQTGIQVGLSQDTMNDIADLVRNNQHHMQAINELGQVFSNMPPGLRTLLKNEPGHPAAQPYFQNEIAPRTEVVELTKVLDEQLKLRIGTGADHQMEKPEHGLAANLFSKGDGSRSV